MEFRHLDENLRNTAARFPDQIAYQYASIQTTYEQLDRQVERIAAYLQAQGATADEGIALILPNSDAFVTLYHGALRLGMYCVPLNPLYTPQELLYMLVDSGVKWIAAPRQFAALAPMVQAQLAGVQMIAVGDGEDALPPGVVSYTELAAFTERPLVPTQHSVEDTAVILYTSGTTGKPKGAMLSHRNLSSNATLIGDFFNYSPEDRIVAVLPMFHVFCLSVCLNAAIFRGAELMIFPRFSPMEVFREVATSRATVFVGVPTMYNFLMQAARQDPAHSEELRSLRLCLSGGAALPVALLEGFEKLFQLEILEGYGLSEASPVTSFVPADGRARKVGSIGVPITGVEQKIFDEADRELPPGEVGELVVRGPNVMKGYWQRPDDTALALRGGWLRTGDLARTDEDGYFYIVDRKKDMIIVGGFNVYPREVEEALFSHPDIVEAAVVGIPDDQYGEAVVACVVAREGLEVSMIYAFCEQRLAKYKRPVRIELMPELPKNQTGKVLRRELRERLSV